MQSQNILDKSGIVHVLHSLILMFFLQYMYYGTKTVLICPPWTCLFCLGTVLILIFYIIESTTSMQFHSKVYLQDTTLRKRLNELEQRVQEAQDLNNSLLVRYYAWSHYPLEDADITQLVHIIRLIKIGLGNGLVPSDNKP